MIELIIQKYLASVLNMPVLLEVPEKPLESYILIEKTGSSEENHIERATLAIQSYAPSMAEAVKLNKKLKDAMRDSVKLGSVSHCTLNSDYNYTDQAKKLYRYQAVFDLVYFD